MATPMSEISTAAKIATLMKPYPLTCLPCDIYWALSTVEKRVYAEAEALALPRKVLTEALVETVALTSTTGSGVIVTTVALAATAVSTVTTGTAAAVALITATVTSATA